MGRPETDIDPGLGPVQRFAFELRKLRQEAGGITYRQMAWQVEVSVSTLSRAAKGEQLPSLPVVLAYVRACGGEERAWERRWRQAVTEQARAADLVVEETVPSPYRGLARFDVGDAELFFGRDEVTDALVRTVTAHRVVAVFGPSGSGKSSLLRAGLIPRLRGLDGPHRPAAVRILTPGEHPLRTHDTVCVPAPGEGDTWLVVDQFEEVFTLCRDTGERAGFLARLLAAAEPASRLRVVLGVRADFYAHCLAHPELAAAIRESTVPVGPMGADALRAVIVKPAQAHGLIVERSLTARLTEQAAGEPGSLPLLSHALLETWRRRRGRTLTLEAYEATGGIHAAIAQTAEDLYARLSPDQSRLVRRILLRLITPGDGTPDTRRPVDRAELDLSDSGGVARVLAHLAAARLVTLDDDRVDLAHESLISSWPRLRQWIEEDRGRLLVHRRLTEAAQAWQELERDHGALYRGTRLAGAEELLTRGEYRGDLTALEQDFLTASVTERDRERVRAARTTRMLRGLTTMLAVLLALALAAGVIVWRQSETNDRQRIKAAAQRLAAVADGMRFSDPRLAQRLSVAAWRIADTPETRSAVVASQGQKERDVFAVPEPAELIETPLSGDGRIVYARKDNKLTAWDTTTRKSRSFAPGDRDSELVAMSPDGRRAAEQDESGRTQLWAIPDRRLGKPLPIAGPVEFTPSGRSLLVRDSLSDDLQGQDAFAELWDVTHQRLISRHTMGIGDRPAANDQYIAWCEANGGRIKLWNARKNRFRPLDGDSKAFCRRGRPALNEETLAIINGSSVRRWDLSTGHQLPALQNVATDPNANPEDQEYTPLRTVVLSDDGRFAVGSSSDAIVLWRTDRPERPVWRYALDNDDVRQLRLDVEDRAIRYLGTGGPSGGTVRTLDLGPAAEHGWRHISQPRGYDAEEELPGAERPNTVTRRLSADGRVLVTVRRHGQKMIIEATHQREGGSTPHPVGTFPAPPMDNGAGTVSADLVSASADGSLLAYGFRSAPGPGLPDRVGLWDTRNRRVVGSVSPRTAVTSVVLSADGTRLATRGEEKVELWDARAQRRLKVLPVPAGEAAAFRPDNGALVTVTTGEDETVSFLTSGKALHKSLGSGFTFALAFSDDSKLLAVGDHLGLVSLWDGATKRRQSILLGTRGTEIGGVTEPVTALAFSPDGTQLAVAGMDGALQLWATASGRQIGQGFLTPGDGITSVAFSADGKKLYAVGSHAPMQHYNVAPEKAAADVCERAAGGLSHADWATHIPEAPYRNIC